VDTVQAIVANPYNLVVSFSNVQNASCAGGTNGTATALPAGGLAPYTFSWNTTPVQTSAIATNLAAGTYTVTVTDSLGASVNQNIAITQPAVLSATTSTSAIACYGGTGTATVTATGGTAPYTYAWNTTPVQTTATATGLGTGIYTVTATDAKGCTATPAAVLLVAPNALTATATTGPATCLTTPNGQAQVTVAGGTAPYTYLWSTGQTTASIGSSLAGVYTVTVTDANGCSVSIGTLAIGTTDYDCDGIPNTTEGTVDTDGDGTPDWQDTDSDNDGILDSTEGTVDTDSDGTPDWRDLDSDGDGILDSTEGTVDTDGDGTPDFRDLDSDGDGISDATEGNVDTDSDGTPDFRDLDSDGDGISDATEGTVDTDGDGTPDFRDLDSDGDGIADATEGLSDTDGDGTPDFRDTDADNDGILDTDEPSDDCDGDGIPNFQDPDPCGVIVPEGFSPNNDGYNDTWEIRNLVYAPNNEVILVNRWGETVYQKVNYDNTFDGTPNRPTSGVSGDGRLPEGTYYFLFYDRTNNQQYNGYVFIAK
jgi:gliding motility-associated-like protein